ncbi:MAG TPA: DNA primase [Patescibacteria group bacterium]
MDQVAQIREKVDIVAFISEYLTLKKAGRNFKANCPFHGENTPSFIVSPERQIWHCFGCGKGGDVYTFLMEYERLEFAEALRFLAKRVGVELISTRGNSQVTSQKERLYEVNSFAKEFYHFVLTKHQAGAKAREYLDKRGVTAKVIDTFMLGFAPGTGEALVKYLMHKKHYPKEDLLEAGLAFVGRYGLLDFFRGRLIFPLIDHRDNVVGFAGRVLDGDVPSKYINTRETLIYHKGEHVFGLNVTKEAIRREKQVILVEGEFDVLSCYEQGVANVVAVKGTALTELQVNLLHRFAAKITFCFDGDRAGQEAIKRSLAVVEKKGLTPTVIVIPEGKDPDEALKQAPGLFKKAVKEDLGVYDYLLTKLSTDSDTATAEGKKNVVNEFLNLISGVQNEVVKEHYLRKLSKEVETSYESIMRELQRITQKQRLVIKQESVISKVKRPREETLEEYLVALIIQNEQPKVALQKAVALLAESMHKEQAYQKLLALLLEYVGKHEAFDGKVFGQGLPEELIPSFNASALFPLPVFDDQEKALLEVDKVARQLRRYYLQKKLKSLAVKIKQQEEDEEADLVEELRKEYSKLASQLEAI